MKLSMIMLDPMIGKEKHRAGGAIFALVSFLNQNNQHMDDIKVRTLNFNSLYPGSSNLYSTIICNDEPDIVAFSTYCWNVELVKEISLNLKRIKSNIIVILGGPEVSFNAKETLIEYPQIDVIIRGEGEETFNELITKLYERKALHEVLGITYRDGKNIVVNPDRSVTENLDDYPSPLLSHTIDLHESNGEVSLETVRGCKFACSYCLYHKGNKNVRTYSEARTEAELKMILTSSDVKMLWFVDPTFNGDETHALKLLQMIKKYNPKMPVAVEIRAELLTDPIIEAMSHVNIAEVGIGLQTSADEVNSNVNRSSDLPTIIKRLKLLSMKIKNTCQQFDMDLIYGLPGDRYENYRNSVNTVLDLNARVFYQPLRVFHGTMLTHDLEQYGVQYNTKAPYNVLCNDTFTLSDMQRAYCLNVGIDFVNRGGNYRSIIEKVAEKLEITLADVLERIGQYFWNTGRYEFFRVSNWTPDDRNNEIVRSSFLEAIRHIVSDASPNLDKDILPRIESFDKDEFSEFELPDELYSMHGYFNLSI